MHNCWPSTPCGLVALTGDITQCEDCPDIDARFADSFFEETPRYDERCALMNDICSFSYVDENGDYDLPF
ncbi:hypothetical protein [Capybara microvirus Cap3_SP_344]|nr:hypothetical protein [Capybara microvirus Cap3_SP_344]